jgi:putative ABC transport system substrate-binding protein
MIRNAEALAMRYGVYIVRRLRLRHLAGCPPDCGGHGFPRRAARPASPLTLKARSDTVRLLGPQGKCMRRREFITLVGGAAATWPLTAQAQQPRMPVVGILSGGSSNAFAPLGVAFRKGLSENGFVEGRNVAFEPGWANGRFDQLSDLAADLVRHQPAVIATVTLPGALAAKAATSTIPIIFVIVEDPVKAGLVASISRPSGNVTGVTSHVNVLGAKRLKLVSEVVPGAAVVALLVNPHNPNAEPDTRDLQTAANSLKRKLHVLAASTEREIETAFAAAVERKVGALFVNIDPFFFSRRDQLAVLAASYRVPTIYPLREFVVAGGLISYGASFATAWHQAGIYVGRILKGTKPSNLPVMEPTKFELVINLKTAKTLGIEVPPTVSARADEVIE